MDESSASLEKPTDAGKGSSGIVRRWSMELKLADKEEEAWRKQAKRVLKRYRGESNYGVNQQRTRDTFNILWSNTETLIPALYSSVPKPDVRRRFRDEDKLGKLGAELIERCLSFSLDTYDFSGAIEMAVVDYLLPGRGLARVDYLPTFGKEPLKEETGEAVMDDNTPVYPKTYESVQCSHVQWDDFRRGPGKRWIDVPWVAFRKNLTRAELVEAFGEQIGNKVELSDPENEDIKKEEDPDVRGIYKTAEVWEIWDKDKSEVIYLCKEYKEAPLKVSPDPLGLENFFPMPEPLVSIKQSDTLVPIPEFMMYETLADELDKVTVRINNIVKSLKIRGIYDAAISEFSKVFGTMENDLIAAENAVQLREKGGLEKSIWMVPIDKHVQVLVQLYQYRESLKQSIYEITGISDIIRGSTNANETFGAQQLKSQWGTLRLQNRQKAIQKFVRDMIRIKAEIISEKFSPETLVMISGLKLPSAVEKQQAQMQAQMLSMQQQPVPDELQKTIMMPGIDDVLGVIRSDAYRSFRIDIETDSTIASQLDTDKKEITELMTGLGGFMQNFAPAMQSGFIPAEVAKTLFLSLIRKFKLGNDVEDAIESMPTNGADNVAKQQEQQAQMENMKQQMEQAQQQVQQAQQKLSQETQALEDGKRELDYNNRVLQLQSDANKQNLEISYKEKEAERIISENAAEMNIERRINDLENTIKELSLTQRQTDAGTSSIN